MAPTKTTTLRVPNELRNEIARIAEERGSSMVEVVSDAIDRLGRDDWWASVHTALNDISPSAVESYENEAQRLDGASSDGL